MTYQSAAREPQTLQTPQTPQARSTEFVPVQGGNDTTSAAGLLVAAYLLMWAALIGFLWLTWRRQGHIEKRLAAVDDSLRRLSEKG